MTACESTSDFFHVLRTEIAGQKLSELAEKYQTPLYLYDADWFRKRLRQLADFDVVRYAQKACSNLSILKLLKAEGAFVDAVSAGEIYRALEAGFTTEGPNPQLVYTADIFDHQALELIKKHNIHVNIGSSDMLEQLAEVTPGATVTLRINPGFGHGHSQKTNTGGEQSKHGIWHEDLPKTLEVARRHNLTVTGVHMHIGSGTDMQHLLKVANALENIALKVGSSVTTISTGGGLPVAYKEDDPQADISTFYALWDRSRRNLEEAFGHPIQLETEPGRFLSAEAGSLLTEIRAVKTMGSYRYLLLDAGFNNLARPVLYGAYHPMAVVPGKDSSTTSVPTVPTVVGGPLCESGDIFTQKEGGYVYTVDLPDAKVGDYLLIGHAGAYGFSMSSNYNSKPFAAEVLLDNNGARLIRRRQTLDDLLTFEKSLSI
ncbi:MAG: diaminopimelate decarboxylase [Pirellulaceae bacterium]|nr:diaminopimelate decarboxylase [Pirellulaceae bacterium]